MKDRIARSLILNTMENGCHRHYPEVAWVRLCGRERTKIDKIKKIVGEMRLLLFFVMN